MALTNQQYETIMKGYEEAQLRNRHLMEAHREEVYSRIPSYRSLEDAAGAVSVEHARRLLQGDELPLADLHTRLDELASRKRKLLIENGFPPDYLVPACNCPLCHDTGYVSGQDDRPQKCRCFIQQEISLLYEQSNIQSVLTRENFSTLSYEYYQGEDLERFQEAVKLCHSFVEHFDKDSGNLFFYGTVGTGKSFLSGCIAGELLKKGYSVIYFSSSGLFDTLARYSFDTKAKETLYNFCKDLYNCDLVIIDDLGTEITNSFVTSQLFSCLNERYLRGKPTIISTNLNLEELRDRYSDRIFSRITSNFKLCKLSGPDIRMYKKRVAAQAQGRANRK